MDRSALSRKTRLGAPSQANPPMHTPRDKRTHGRGSTSGKIKTAKDSNEITRVPRRTVPLERRQTEDPNTRHFTVANVGPGGQLYLKPSRLPLSSFNRAPTTPPGTSDGEHARNDWAGERQSNASGSWTPQLRAARIGTYDHAIPVPPLSLANISQKRRPRSHSFSTASERERERERVTVDSNDFQLLVNGKDSASRPKSSVDLSGGLLDLHIPHYRLGTPRFSELGGTAYLHSSMYTSTTTDDMRSSVMTQAEYDKLFPAPPGMAHITPSASRNPSLAYLHPSAARSMTPTRTPPPMLLPPTPPTLSRSPTDTISSTVFDKVESSPNDASIVRYNAHGRISAATPARLVAQITSPVFLDYELLSDFFLTYRSFLPSRELLEYLLARMRWAFGTPTDAGRIVRVRTFVALRHWILNYFPDDFVLDTDFRQRFCALVNDLARTLRQREDRGGSDLNILGELKKCWSRTCATYWPARDTTGPGPDADIFPGGGLGSSVSGTSTNSLPLPTQPSRGDFRRLSAPLQIPADRDTVLSWGQESTMQAFGPARRSTIRTASIPASPMSEQSLQVLSCSVPFLRHIKPMMDAEDAAHNARQQHKRSGSFTDALRDGRTPLPSAKVDSVDVQTLNATTFTGGLVRGLLLQPSPAKVDLMIPISPGVDPRAVHFGGMDTNYFPDRAGQQSLGVKRIVGDVRRALSSRHRRQDSPPRSHGSHRSTNSSSSRTSARDANTEATSQQSAWQQLRGPPRIDALGEKVGRSYDEAFFEVNLPNPAGEQIRPEISTQHEREYSVAPDEDDRALSLPRPDFERLNSHLTTGSRSILIMDDTGSPKSPGVLGALPSVSSWSQDMTPQPLFRNPEEVFQDISKHPYDAGAVESTHVGASPNHQTELDKTSPDRHMHDTLVVPDSWYLARADLEDGSGIASASSQARKSSGVHSPGLDMPQTQHQLRRRPGGDLKAADHVHELQPMPRPDTYGSLSTVSQSGPPSGVQSYQLSGTHFSGQDFATWRMPTQSMIAQKKDSVSLLSMEPELEGSFAVEATKLAKIPDRAHDGGIEDTLRRLEGEAATSAGKGADKPSAPPVASRQPPDDALRLTGVKAAADQPQGLEFPVLASPMTETQGASIYHLSSSEAVYDYKLHSVVSSGPYEASEAQGSTAPVLPAFGKKDRYPIRQLQSPPTSPKVVEFATGKPGVQSPTQAHKPTKSDSTGAQGSFLLDDNESLSDISTDIADQSGDEGLGVRSFFFDDTIDDDDDDLRLPFKIPPTPPSTAGAPKSPEVLVLRTVTKDDAAHRLKEAQSAPKLLSPNADRHRMVQHEGQPALLPLQSELRRVRTAPSAHPPTHLPFVLAFESEVIAEQLTIIEKDALDEVDWKDLIGLNWQQSPPNVRNWVEYLKKDLITGIDIVVARFNLVVKWVVSEIVLTAAPSERARCIAKYIHIATHCHRRRNYASMYQITLALLSADLARLHMTWALVAPVEKQKLERLEKLCQPLRNFQNLRAEMETSTGQIGCIPFIGLYTHDLMYNAQKPARIAPASPSDEPLINFERFQTAATIVKSLLRLIEASSKYIFHPHPEVLSRCLWLAALEDTEIVRHSKTLEQ
ncbi:Guanine nucleotide exchange factor lte1 [Teratosphaeriaceae sp. CCFEE 6253]|nr:Guanine nucleotide exchange factor lte1 [Teratosphaeriaceae sp. CCFEE 6253]